MKLLYFDDRLDIESVHDMSKDSYNSFELKEYFVDSFTNFKSFEVDEKNTSGCESSPDKVIAFIKNYDFLKDKNKPNNISELVEQDQNKVRLNFIHYSYRKMRKKKYHMIQLGL